MAWRDWGNPPVFSSNAQPVSNPSTGTLCAELDSTQLGTKDLAVDQKILVQTTWIVGGDTLATWQLEVGKSTALAASTQVVFVKSPTGQSGQYVTTNELKKDYRLRARVNSTFTASVTASIIAERLT
jgi:hypothetical protein